jgi:arabinose-5-phosphate isomerase
MSTDSNKSVLLSARAVLNAESAALKIVAEELNQSFCLAVQEICNLSPAGKIILSGMGKAGFIAMKISATLASIGLPSFYLHPAEAIHGDLGRFTKNDIALVLSNSGETPEILRLIPHLKKVGCPVLCITALETSSLSRYSDIAICFGKHEEAAPLGVAPTVSTTIMLALGDALAMAVAEKLKITKEHFAKYHPGGELGKSLTIVKDIMRSGSKHCIVNKEILVREVIQSKIAASGRPGAVTVVDNTGALVGIFTDGDLGRCLAKGTKFLEQPVADVMGKNPKCINQEKLVEEALHIMHEFEVDELIVIDQDKKPVGMIDIQDILALQTS